MAPEPPPALHAPPAPAGHASWVMSDSEDEQPAVDDVALTAAVDDVDTSEMRVDELLAVIEKHCPLPAYRAPMRPAESHHWIPTDMKHLLFVPATFIDHVVEKHTFCVAYVRRRLQECRDEARGAADAAGIHSVLFDMYCLLGAPFFNKYLRAVTDPPPPEQPPPEKPPEPPALETAQATGHQRYLVTFDRQVARGHVNGHSALVAAVMSTNLFQNDPAVIMAAAHMLRVGRARKDERRGRGLNGRTACLAVGMCEVTARRKRKQADKAADVIASHKPTHAVLQELEEVARLKSQTEVNGIPREVIEVMGCLLMQVAAAERKERKELEELKAPDPAKCNLECTEALSPRPPSPSPSYASSMENDDRADQADQAALSEAGVYGTCIVPTCTKMRRGPSGYCKSHKPRGYTQYADRVYPIGTPWRGTPNEMANRAKQPRPSRASAKPKEPCTIQGIGCAKWKHYHLDGACRVCGSRVRQQRFAKAQRAEREAVAIAREASLATLAQEEQEREQEREQEAAVAPELPPAAASLSTLADAALRDANEASPEDAPVRIGRQRSAATLARPPKKRKDRLGALESTAADAIAALGAEAELEKERRNALYDRRCPICFDPFVRDSYLSLDHPTEFWGRTICCKTRYHFECLNRWLDPTAMTKGSAGKKVKMQKRCPTCREVLPRSKLRAFDTRIGPELPDGYEEEEPLPLPKAEEAAELVCEPCDDPSAQPPSLPAKRQGGNRRRCQLHPHCVRGFRHRGRGGRCRIRPPAAAETAAEPGDVDFEAESVVSMEACGGSETAGASDDDGESSEQAPTPRGPDSVRGARGARGGPWAPSLMMH